jgi:hypothetical protein
MSLENLQKAFVCLRRLIAIAELIGLSKTFRTVELHRLNEVNDDRMRFQKTQLWETICSADRLFAMIINIPPCTRRHQMVHALELTIDGVVQPRAYLNRLTNIAAKVQDLDDLNTVQESKAEVYAYALKIDQELKMLASQTPKSWWITDMEHVKPDHMLQFFHYCTAMRIHLPLTMGKDPDEEYIYSRLACTDACESLVERYQILRRRLPSGTFISRLLDLQAFIATVVLLLTSYGSLTTDRSRLRFDKARITSLVGQVVRVMNEKSAGSNFALNGVKAVRSLRTLLQRDCRDPQVQELTLRVPLLGKVCITRNFSRSQASKTDVIQSTQSPSEPVLLKATEHFMPQQYESLPLPADTVVDPDFRPQGESPWDPLSWSIEDYNENFFQDALMTESFAQFDIWQNDYNNLEFDT